MMIPESVAFYLIGLPFFLSSSHYTSASYVDMETQIFIMSSTRLPSANGAARIISSVSTMGFT